VGLERRRHEHAQPDVPFAGLYKSDGGRAVPDQRLYDTIYQERYMGHPVRQHRRLQEGIGDQLRRGD
jgi:hypothetical protein